MDEIWFDECVSADEPKSIPKWKIGRICKDVKQDKKSKFKKIYNERGKYTKWRKSGIIPNTHRR